MPRHHRVKICPEITDPNKRIFLDAVPMVRRIQEDAIRKMELAGERIEVPCREKNVPVWLHRAPGAVENARRPLLLEFHGGGFVFGSAAVDDGFCETICRMADIHVAGVDYSLAPDRQFPTQIEEAWDVIAWFREHAAEYGIDPGQIAVTGFSAGANLAAAVALKAAYEGAGWLKAQILHYPFLDFELELKKEPDYAADVDPILVEGFVEFYCEKKERALPLVSPVYAEPAQLRGMAPALIIPAGQDRLCGQGLQYAELLKQAGVETEAYVMPDAHHCYVEDACNPVMYDQTTLPAKRKLHSPVFRERAEEAVRMSADFLRQKTAG